LEKLEYSAIIQNGIRDAGNLETWLNSLPVESCIKFARIIATRTALRVVPFASRAFSPQIKDFALPVRLTIAVFRAAAVSRVVLRHSANKAGLTAASNAASAAAAVRDAAHTLGARQTSNQKFFGTSASDCAFAAADAADAAAFVAAAFDAAAARNAAANAASAAGTADVDIWNAITTDAKLLLASMDQPMTLLDSELWPNKVPEWWLREFEAMKDVRLDARVHARPSWGLTSKEADSIEERIAFGDRRDDFWERDPEVVNSEIVKWLKYAGWKEQSKTTKSTDDETSRPLNQNPKKLDAEKAKGGEKTTRESVSIQSDEPTNRDRLGRRPFAQALVERMNEVLAHSGPDGFAVHIHAPWGAGKTSVLRMMEEVMSQGASVEGKRWTIVHFNAWRNERRKPPWWPLVEALEVSASGTLWREKKWLKWLWQKTGWWCWRIVVDWFHFAAIGFLLFVAAFWLSYAGASNPSPESENGVTHFMLQLAHGNLPWDAKVVVATEEGWFSRLNNFADGWLKPIVDKVAVFAAVVTAVISTMRAAMFGSASNANIYSDLSKDPMRRVIRRFGNMVARTKQPVAVFIDDLDRCSSDYTVDLLEGIQTMFRRPNVVYVIAADREWIKASFEKRFDTFKGNVGSPGQPLGYLFLEKIFQISTPLPVVGANISEKFWRELLGGNSSASTVNLVTNTKKRSKSLNDEESARLELDAEIQRNRENIRNTYSDRFTQIELQDYFSKAGKSPTVRAAAALEINVSPSAEREAEHLLEPYADGASRIPRVMKRIVNAFAMRRTTAILEESSVPVDALVRWTMIEQRWPGLADVLARDPESVNVLGAVSGVAKNQKVAVEMMPFIGNVDLQKIIGAKNKRGLSAAHITLLTRGTTLIEIAKHDTIPSSRAR
jgi:KAP family P-loop domain